MSQDVLISEHPVGIELFEDADEGIKMRVELTKHFRFEPVRFSPVWSSLVSRDDRFECRKKFAIRNVEIVGSVLDNTYPTSLLPITGTKPDIVRRGEADFNGEMWPCTVWVLLFFH